MSIKTIEEGKINEEAIQNVQKSLWNEIDKKINEYLKSVIELLLQEELTRQLKAGWYERNGERVSQRNGSYDRELTTMYGTIPDVSVPRQREGSFQTELFDRYQRRQGHVDEAIGRLFLAGVSTRTLGKLTKELTGKAVSAGTVSTINKKLDEKTVAFQTQQLSDCYVFLFLDGIAHKVRETGMVTDKVCLCALGVKADGTKELLSFRIVDSESEANWRAFIVDIKGRGLRGKMLKLIITDGNGGCLAALSDLYPFVERQRCIIHKMRNIGQKITKRANKKSCLSGVSQIFAAASKTEAIERFKQWKEQWMVLEEKAVVCLESNLSECLAYYAFEPKFWSLIRTTNPLERSFREIRRRTDPVSSFTDDSTLERMTYGLFDGMNENWKAL